MGTNLTQLAAGAVAVPVAAPPSGPAGSNDHEMPLGGELRAPLILGLSAMVLFFVVGGVWSATAPLSGAVIASGVVSPESSRQTVQHLEGGIIREFRVREGQQVQAGDILVILEGVRAKAEAGARMSRFRALLATEARLRAEHAGKSAVEFTHPALADRANPEVRDAIQAQRNQFRGRRESAASRVAILRQRIVQLKTQIVGFQRQLQGTKKQREHIAEEVADAKTLFAKGLQRKSRMLQLQREQAKLVGAEGELGARIARTRQAVGETGLQVINLEIERREEIDTQLSELIGKRAELEKEMRVSFDRLRRTEIRSPIAGTVIDLRYKTPGGVIRAGEPILDLVPLAAELVIEARVRPRDIDDVYAGQNAYLLFPSFAQRNLKRIEGRLQSISPDALEDARTGERYYSARVTVDRAYLKKIAPEIQLSPGMPAEVYIATRERTVLEYLLQPFLQTLERAFRES